MIDPKEIRLGNLVTVDNEVHEIIKGIPMAVTALHEVKNLDNTGWTYAVSLEHINQLPNTYYLKYNQLIEFIEPIKLTEEWLVKLGWEYHDKLGFWVHNWGENGIEFIRFDKHYDKFSFQLGTAKYKILDSVHQLQNLYHALTGKELI